MIKSVPFAMIMAVLLSFAMPTQAKTSPEAFKAKVASKLLSVNPRFKIAGVEPAQMKGFYKVQLENGPFLYMSEDGNHFFEGTLYKFDAKNKLVNLTEKDADSKRAVLVKEFKADDMVVFAPTSPVKTKAVINVFTDVDCFYCQKLHQEVPELNARGIEVRYLAFPRAGIGSGSYKKIVSAWCADDQQDSMTKLKNRQEIPEKSCDNPVAKQYDLGKRMGVNGTPAIVLEDGTMIPGYRPAADLAKMLGI